MAMIKPSARHKARRFAAQALYQWHFAKQPAAQIRKDFLAENNMAKVDMTYYDAITEGTIANVVALDDKLMQLDLKIDNTELDSLDELDPLTLAILRLALFELTERIDVPYSVVIDEAIKISKLFGAEDSYLFVNHVLDQAAQQWRATEYRRHFSED